MPGSIPCHQLRPTLKPSTGYKIIDDFRPALAAFVLGGFAGMRSCEMMKVYANDQVIQWEDIKWKKNHIHVRDEVAKQTRRDNDQRFIPLEPAVVAWLKAESPKPPDRSLNSPRALSVSIDGNYWLG